MVLDDVRAIVGKHARLSVELTSLTDDSDLYLAGLTSLSTVNLMLALEDCFNVEFPNTMLSRKTFHSIRTLTDAVEDLVAK
jgi:acyl carrier protein